MNAVTTPCSPADSIRHLDRPAERIVPQLGSWLILLLAGCLLGPGIAKASSLDTQRLTFVVADKALENRDKALFNQLKPALKDYPLYPYLLDRDLRQRLRENPIREIRDFLETYNDLPLTHRLRTLWLERLAAERRWADFLYDYRPGVGPALECWQRQALLHNGQPEAALKGIEEVWMSGVSLPDACDPLFKRWQAQGGFTQERVWQRFSLAMSISQLRLARYLQRLMPAKDQALAELWLKVDHNPRLILEAKHFNPAHPYTATILIHGLHRWSRIDSVTAVTALDILKQRYRLPEDKVAELDRKLATYVASRRHPDALARLTALPRALVDTSVQEWRIRTSLQRGDWQATLKWLDEMSPEVNTSAQWRYWRARALEATGQDKDAKRLYRELADERDYHGFLAADRLGVPYQVSHIPLQIPIEELDTFLAKHPGILRARELYLLKRPWEARSEWGHAVRHLGKEDLQKAAKLAQGWGWHYQAITTLARTGYWDDLELRFPLPHQDQVITSARAKNIDPAWVYAVMRQESIFQSDAKSSAGALGLMQIMPATGQRIAKDLKARLPGSYALLQTDTNIHYGTHYLRHTLDQLQGNPLLATAAYNAGPHQVAKWLPEQLTMDADIWVETIPFFETRQYVKRVMEYATIYGQRLGQPPVSLRARMAAVLPRALDLHPTESGTMQAHADMEQEIRVE